MSAEKNREVISQRKPTVDDSFDELAKGFASGTTSRRRVLRLMGSALVGAALASFSGIAWAAPPEGRGRCPSPEDRRCRGVCTNVVFDRFNCGRCGNVCAAGEGCCGGRCVSLNTTENCGGCSVGCHKAEICVNGTCQCPQAGQTLCANECCPEGHCVIDETGAFTCVV